MCVYVCKLHFHLRRKISSFQNAVFHEAVKEKGTEWAEMILISEVVTLSRVLFSLFLHSIPDMSTMWIFSPCCFLVLSVGLSVAELQ